MNSIILAVGASLTLLMTFAQQAREAVMNFVSILIGKVEVDKTLASAIFSHCNRHFKIFSIRNRTFFGMKVKNEDTLREQLIDVEDMSRNYIIFRHGWRFLVVSPGAWLYDDQTNQYERGFSILLPRLMWNSKRFIDEALSSFNINELKRNRFQVVNFHGKGSKEMVMPVTDPKTEKAKGNETEIKEDIKSGFYLTDKHDFLSDYYTKNKTTPFESFDFQEDLMAFYDFAKKWIASKAWYTEKNIPWTLGVLLHGKQGTGKTLFFKCLAQELNIPIYLFDLSSMNNKELATFWKKCRLNKPCMILLEDFDNVFNKRKNVSKTENGITFDCLLNCISGAGDNDGVLLGITTNKISSIDPALGVKVKGSNLVSRPGRIDRIIEVKLMSEKSKRFYLHKLFPNQESIHEEILALTKNSTAAQFSEACKVKMLMSKDM